MMKTIAVLIRSAGRICEALRTTRRLAEAGVRVQVLLVDHTAVSGWKVDADGRRQRGICCFSNNSSNHGRHGFRYAGIRQMAEMMSAADLVIPF